MSRQAVFQYCVVVAVVGVLFFSIRSVQGIPEPPLPQEVCYPGSPLTNPFPQIVEISLGQSIILPELTPPGVSAGKKYQVNGRRYAVTYSNGPAYFVQDIADAYLYHVRASATAYCSVSLVAPCDPVIDYEFLTLTYRITNAVDGLPIIVSQPSDQTVAAGQWAVLAVAATGPPSLSYQWQYEGQDISGATNTTLVLDQCTTNDNGHYAVIVTNPGGSISSSTVLLTVLEGSSGTGTVWFVNTVGGSDAYDGRSPVPDGTHGPFARINKGLTSAVDGDTVSVLSGVYHEDVDLRGRNIQFLVYGNVTLH